MNNETVQAALEDLFSIPQNVDALEEIVAPLGDLNLNIDSSAYKDYE